MSIKFLLSRPRTHLYEVEEAGTATVLFDGVNVVLIAGVAGAATVVAVITSLVVLLARHCTKEFLCTDEGTFGSWRWPCGMKTFALVGFGLSP